MTFICAVSDQPVPSMAWLMMRGVDASACGRSRTAALKCSLFEVCGACVAVAERLDEDVLGGVIEAARPVEPEFAVVGLRFEIERC